MDNVAAHLRQSAARLHSAGAGARGAAECAARRDVGAWAAAQVAGAAGGDPFDAAVAVEAAARAACLGEAESGGCCAFGRVAAAAAAALDGAGQESEIPNFKGSYLGRFPLVSADFWTSDHLSERSRSVDDFSGTRARGTITLKRR